jgi:hypothetical protein
MHKTFAALAVLAATLVTTVFGTHPATASAAVNFISWPKDVIYVYDTTAKLKTADGSALWPVRAAAERWDDNNPVDFRYTTRGCPKGYQCVVVRQSELASPAVGSTATTHVGADITASSVVLDTTFGRTNNATKRRNVVCHELGHTLGLQHRLGTSSCMTSYVTNQKYPDATDIKNLNTMYGYR